MEKDHNTNHDIAKSRPYVSSRKCWSHKWQHKYATPHFFKWVATSFMELRLTNKNFICKGPDCNKQRKLILSCLELFKGVSLFFRITIHINLVLTRLNLIFLAHRSLGELNWHVILFLLSRVFVCKKIHNYYFILSNQNPTRIFIASWYSSSEFQVSFHFVSFNHYYCLERNHVHLQNDLKDRNKDLPACFEISH